MQRNGLKIWCFSLVPDWALPEGPCKPAGHWQGAACGVANACTRRVESLHNGCGANDAPGDTNSLAPLPHDAWTGLPYPDDASGKGKIQDKLKVSSPVLTRADFELDHNGSEC